MNEAKHTPTPWVRGDPEGNDALATVRTADGENVIAEVYFADGNGTREQAEADLAHMLAAPDLADALAEYVADSDVSLESLERVSEEFRRDTGFLAPGKDESAAVNSGVTAEQRRAAWNAWTAKRRSAQLAKGRAALRKAGRIP